jgi:hypothetical protein
MMTKSLKLDNKHSDAKMKEPKKGQNLLSRFHQESDMHLNEDWNHQESCDKKPKLTTFAREVLTAERSEESKEIE